MDTTFGQREKLIRVKEIDGGFGVFDAKGMLIEVYKTRKAAESNAQALAEKN